MKNKNPLSYVDTLYFLFYKISEYIVEKPLLWAVGVVEIKQFPFLFRNKNKISTMVHQFFWSLLDNKMCSTTYFTRLKYCKQKHKGGSGGAGI